MPVGIAAQDRQLVPFSATVVGVTATWADASAARSIEVLNGGYVDDITEPYDGLVPAQGGTVKGATATVLTTVFLKRRVYVGYWRDLTVAKPCDVHALTTLGLTGSEFYAVLRSLR